MASTSTASTKRADYWLVVALVTATIAGCRLPDAATTNRRGPGDQFAPTLVLEGGSARDAIRAMRAPAAGDTPRPLLTAEGGVRWSDAEMAIRNVADRHFVGVAGIEHSDARVVASTVMPDGQSGFVEAIRLSDGHVECRARLTMLDLALDAAFESDFATELRRLGQIPRPQE
jgi:hypothetical protein